MNVYSLERQAYSRYTYLNAGPQKHPNCATWRLRLAALFLSRSVSLARYASRSRSHFLMTAIYDPYARPISSQGRRDVQYNHRNNASDLSLSFLNLIVTITKTSIHTSRNIAGINRRNCSI